MIAINKHSTKLKIWSVEMPNAPYLERYAQLEKNENTAKKKKPTAQIAHLVFANAQSQNTKNQKSNFLPTLDRNHSKKCNFDT